MAHNSPFYVPFVFFVPITKNMYVFVDVCGKKNTHTNKKLLSRIRWGQCTPDVLEELRSCSERRFGGEDGIEETQLLTHKADVLRVNEEVRTSVCFVKVL